MIWKKKKKKSKIKKLYQLIKTFNILIKQFCLIIWSVKKKQILKSQKLHKQETVWWSCSVCNSRKSRFVKEQEVSGFLRSPGVKTL